MKTQEQRIKDKLDRDGFVTRNECLRVRITRLGAIICDLQKQGYDFFAHFEKTEHGKDYIYELRDKPKKKKVEVIDGIARVVMV